jgi:hypothetical protein
MQKPIALNASSTPGMRRKPAWTACAAPPLRVSTSLRVAASVKARISADAPSRCASAGTPRPAIAAPRAAPTIPPMLNIE